MCGSLSEEGSDLKLFISKLQTQLSGALSESNSLRGTAKSLEAKVFELMSETQMYRGQIDELQVILFRLGQALFPRFFARVTLHSRCFFVPRTSNAVWTLILKPKPSAPLRIFRLNLPRPTTFCQRSGSKSLMNRTPGAILKCSSRIPPSILRSLGCASRTLTPPTVNCRSACRRRRSRHARVIAV
jgi:hypothetical protein